MRKTVDISGLPMLVVQCLMAGVVVAEVATVAVSGLFAVVGGSPAGAVWLVAVVGLWLGLMAPLVRLLGGDAGGGTDVWSEIPREQYLGRFAEGGGLARYEWEKELDRLGGAGDGLTEDPER